ncbi:MAG TPA: molybdopterin cofactor-binding domain-containing protein, partial [Stellaceae bacterium]|nr:molybdopterin cofactor-binding domain-containing protein [Stellaceae bacterium]
MGEFGIGQSVSRFEDPRLLQGGGRYIDDVNLPGQAHATLLRSPHAHARIVRLDLDAARALPGVLGIFTQADLAADKLGTTTVQIQRKRADGSPLFSRPHPGLAKDRVRYVGDPIALVVGETLDAARDAAEAIDIEFETLPAATSTAGAVSPGAPAVWDECPDNVSHIFETGNKAATEAAFAKAAHVLNRRYVITRVHAQFMEPRGAIGQWDPREERFTLYADVQYPHRVRQMLANSIFKVPEQQIRVVAGDVGGGFGTKGWQYPEHRLVLWAARKLGRPVKWRCERSEAQLADEHGRDVVADAALALDADGKFLAIKVGTISNIGAYLSSDRNLLATFGSLGAVVGTYAIPAAYAHLTVAFSNMSGTAPYRGAGRPEAIYIIERLIDDAARAFGMDRIELRRKNLIAPAAMPYKTPLGGLNYDCGDFARNMELAVELADVKGFSARRQASAARG